MNNKILHYSYQHIYLFDSGVFLQEKRSLFPRFYFIGDDDLLEILGQATNPTVIQSHLKKLFAGIHSVDFDEGCDHIVAMKSLDGEVVPLQRKVQITPEVEVPVYCVLALRFLRQGGVCFILCCLLLTGAAELQDYLWMCYVCLLQIISIHPILELQ